jgi:hypothetical protein
LPSYSTPLAGNCCSLCPCLPDEIQRFCNLI